jgi:hypothetical protein
MARGRPRTTIATLPVHFVTARTVIRGMMSGAIR